MNPELAKKKKKNSLSLFSWSKDKEIDMIINTTHTHTHRERERESKSKRWLWIVGTIILVSGIGTITYFATKTTETPTKSPSDNPTGNTIQTLQSQLSQIKSTLNKPENSAKKVKHSVQLTDIENKLNNLASKNSQEQEKIVKELEKKIEDINKELDIKSDSPPEKKDDKPTDNPAPSDNPRDNPDDSPKEKEPTNNYQQQFETRKNRNNKLSAILDKISKRYKERNDDVIYAKTKAVAERYRINYNASNNNKSNLSNYFTDTQSQAFTKLGADSQKANLELIDSVFESILSDTKRILVDTLIKDFKEVSIGYKPESQQFIDIITGLENKLNSNFKKDDFENWIRIIREVWEKMEKFHWVEKWNNFKQ